jgi:hypothetical protein
MTVVHAIHSNRFTQIDNDILRDERLSFRAHGFHSYLLSFPTDWEIDLNYIARRFREGITAIRSAMNELIEFGYARRIVKRSPTGQIEKWDYEIYERPLPIDPFPEKVHAPVVEPVLQLSLPIENVSAEQQSGLPLVAQLEVANRSHINNVFNEEGIKKDLSLSETKNVERENFENFSNKAESPAKTSVEPRNKDKSRRAASAWANLDNTLKNFCWQQVDKLPNRPADPIAWILSRLEHLEAEYERLYPQTASLDSRYSEWKAILDDPMRGVAYLMAQVPSDCPEYEERYNFAFRR